MIKRMALVALIFCFGVLATFAHPHVAFEARLEIEITGGRCVGFWEEWTFDSFFSAMVIGEFDANRDGRFDATENAKLEKGYFANLRKYGYFTFIRTGESRWSPDRVEGFLGRIEGDRLVYRFRVPLEAKDPGKEFALAVFDATFYCAVSYAGKAASFPGASPASWKREVNDRFPIYYNPMGAASDSTVYNTWKPGLQTAYPEEIIVRL